MRALLVGSIALLLADSARADMLGPGEKGVALSIRVDAALPAGKTLVLTGTSSAVDILRTGEVQKIEWHPLGGALQLRLIDTRVVARLAEARANIERDRALPTVPDGPACGEAFSGVRTLPESSPADEVRWNFRVTLAGKRCDATLVSTEYFAGDGKPVDPAATAPTAADLREPIPPPRPPDAPPEAPPALASPQVVAPATPPPAPAPASGGCHIGEATSLPALWLALLLVARRRRAA